MLCYKYSGNKREYDEAFEGDVLALPAATGPKPIKPRGADDADNEIIAAVYAELYSYDPQPKYIANAVDVLSKQINGTKTNYWSW
jgi:hypothetical protein